MLSVKSMVADLEIICVGNELLIGKIHDTNAHYLSFQATRLGVNVKRVTVIQDITEEIATTVKEALARKPGFIITTGGLGPTFDDKTLLGIAEGLNRKLELNEKALEMIKQRYKEFAKQRNLPVDFELTKPRLKMAMLPEKAEPLHNPVGTAPGVLVDLQGTILFALPGVPLEMEAIFQETIAPMLKQASGKNGFYETSLFIDSLMESVLSPLIDKVMNDNKGVYVKSHVKIGSAKPHIEIHFTIVGQSDDEPNEKLEKAKSQLSKLIEKSGLKTISK